MLSHNKWKHVEGNHVVSYLLSKMKADCTELRFFNDLEMPLESQ